jgi:hypothetical protein
METLDVAADCAASTDKVGMKNVEFHTRAFVSYSVTDIVLMPKILQLLVSN